MRLERIAWYVIDLRQHGRLLDRVSHHARVLNE